MQNTITTCGEHKIILSECDGQYTVRTLLGRDEVYAETTFSRRQAERWVAMEIKQIEKEQGE